ncbi:MAG: hypothetical protein UU10_C0040G0001, partial [Parcubacteria group bacterium GW2011_GWF1_40_6]
PTWCPECRMTRRLAFTNTWNVFWNKCALCGVKTLSLYPPNSQIKVYCQPCWWGDSWDGSEYAMDYDPNRPFLAQWKELSEKTPFVILETDYLTLKNCEYSGSIAYSKNCYMTIWADYCENVYYSSILNGLKFSSDCLRGWESELCYESIGFINNYKTFFSDDCDNCVDVWFSRNCYSCTNCVGCVNMRGVTNCIFNIKYSKEEYEEKIKEMKLDSWGGLQEVKKKAQKFWRTKPYREYHGHTLNLNVTGEYTYRSKNSKEGYIVNYAENCKWCQLITVASIKDCYDYTGWGNNAELMYESVQVGDKASNVKFSSHCLPDVLNTEYSFWCIGSKNNFGCVNLKRKSYCILNKQYLKEEYEKLKVQIIEDMKKNPYIDERGRAWPYGEFFAPGFVKVAYNNSNAMKFFPKTKEQALSLGYVWSDEENPTSKCTIKSKKLPETIKETDNSILEEIIECSNCTRAYKIVQGELSLLRKMNLPIPHECPKCRENKRFTRMNKPGMYHRKCDKCNVNIYTPYAPDRPEIVYCVKCYQAEFA